MKKIFLPVFFLFLLNCIACSKKADRPKVEELEPVYKPDIVWTLKTKSFGPYGQPNQYDKYLYCIESNWRFVDKGIKFNIAKIDLSTGLYVWQSSTVNGRDASKVIRCGNYVYVHNSNGLVFCYKDVDGTLCATIKLGKTKEEIKVNEIWYDSFIAYDKYLFWGNKETNKINDEGLLRLDTAKIDFSKPAADEQVILPELVWHGENEDGIQICPIEENGIIYFQTYDRLDPRNTIRAAINADTCEVLWQKESEVWGRGGNCMYILGDRLYVFGEQQCCYEKKTGKVIFEKIQTIKDYSKDYYLGASFMLPGVTYSDKKFYYTNISGWATAAMSKTPENLNKNILCVDAKTGKYIWGDLAKGSGSLHTRPIVANGKCFVLNDKLGLRVYNAKNGKLIGVDKSVVTYGEDRNAQYGGLVIYFNLDYESQTATLTAIRP